MNNIYWSTIGRSVLSAVYAFGGLHLLLVPTGWLAMYGICGLLLSPVVGLVHGLSMCCVMGVPYTSEGEERYGGRTWYYILSIVAGGATYAAGSVVATSLVAPSNGLSDAFSDHPVAGLLIASISRDPLFGIAIIIGGIVGGRLGKWVYQEAGY